MLNIDDRFLGETTQDQFWLMCHIARFIGKDSACFPSNQTLCESTGWKISKLNEVKKSCIDAGFLKADARYYKNRQSSNEYTITTDRISIMVNLKGKRAVQIPATYAVGYHAGGTLGTTLAAPPPATLAAPEVLISKEVLTNECERAPAKNEKPFDLNTEQNPAKKEGSAGPAAPPSGWRPVDPEEEVILMKSDDLCREHFFRQTRLPIDRFDALLSDFLLKVKSESHQHNNRKDFRSHFFNWARTRNGGADAMRQGAPTGQPAGPSYANLKTYGS